MTDLTRREILAGAAALAGASAAQAADAPEYLSAAQVVDALRARRFSSLELTDRVIARIERHDPSLNAVIARDFDRAREAAKAADAALARGENRPLLGVPMTVKESFNVAGLPTTWGIAQAKDFRASDDALIVTRVRGAGAVVLGKTNVPLALADWQSYNAIYGVTRNPWNLERTPGGSSGGSAAALAAGFGALSLGSDIGGSLRVPAHFTGTLSLKPSHGLVPSRGHTPPGFAPLPREVDLAVVGPMARSASDLALELDILAGPDELRDAVGYRLALPPPRHEALKDFRVLVVDTHPLLPTSASVRAALERLSERLGKAGVTVARESPLLPDFADAARLYMRLLLPVFAAPWPLEQYNQVKAAAAALPPDDNSLSAERLRGAVLSHRDWVAADGARAGLRERWRKLFLEWDVVICPTMPTPPYPHDHSMPDYARKIDIDGKEYPYQDQLVWAGVATTPGLPATAAPIDRSDTGLPIGVQIVGPYLEDRTTIAFAELMEREFGGFVPPPGYAG